MITLHPAGNTSRSAPGLAEKKYWSQRNKRAGCNGRYISPLTANGNGYRDREPGIRDELGGSRGSKVSKVSKVPEVPEVKGLSNF
jgi:hypothetical protein